jgi:hypothetical protein
MITESMKQQVITRLATINSATSILSLINGRPAKVTVEEVLALAETIERWAWRNLLTEGAAIPAPAVPAFREEPPALDLNPGKGADPTPPSSQFDRPQPAQAKPNGQQRWGGSASEKQINAIFAIGRDKGYEANNLKALISERLGKSVMQLTSREASKLIDDLKAL